MDDPHVTELEHRVRDLHDEVLMLQEQLSGCLSCRKREELELALSKALGHPSFDEIPDVGQMLLEVRSLRLYFRKSIRDEQPMVYSGSKQQ